MKYVGHAHMQTVTGKNSKFTHYSIRVYLQIGNGIDELVALPDI